MPPATKPSTRAAPKAPKPSPAAPAAPSSPSAPADLDGRHARRDRNKVAVVDAYLDLIREGVARPSVAEVAERSGISHRSVFRYFADKDEMARTSIQRQQGRIAPLLKQQIDGTLPLTERVDLFVERRLHLYETIAPSARLSRNIASSQPVIQAQLTTARSEIRANVKKVFSPELGAMAAPVAAEILAALDVLTSFEAVDLLRMDQGMSKARVARSLRRAILTLLGAAPD